jgi:hypothetical protein
MKKKGIQLHTLVRIMAGFLNKFLFENMREDTRFANRKVRNFDVHEVRLGTKNKISKSITWANFHLPP